MAHVRASRRTNQFGELAQSVDAGTAAEQSACGAKKDCRKSGAAESDRADIRFNQPIGFSQRERESLPSADCTVALSILVFSGTGARRGATQYVETGSPTRWNHSAVERTICVEAGKRLLATSKGGKENVLVPLMTDLLA
jgi:hypothetical protein